MGVSRIKWLVMDVDGTLTDGKIYMGSDGEVMKAFDVRDGYAIANMLPEMGIEPVIITGRESSIVAQRCVELSIGFVYQGVEDKARMLRGLLGCSDSDLSAVAYMGDDLNDLECMRAIKEAGGLVACPANAVAEVRECSDYTADKAGGDGAVREFVEWLSNKAGEALCE